MFNVTYYEQSNNAVDVKVDAIQSYIYWNYVQLADTSES